jgi:flagellar hook-basal body complex protein FliE
MTVNFTQAIAAYAEAASKVGKGEAVPDSGQATTSFADLLTQATSGAVDTARAGEQISMHAVANQAELNEIVTAVTNAELTLQTVVAVRDRIIQAYQEIIRMPI